MYSNTTGSNNVAIGRDAANYLTTGSNNVAIGGRVAGPSLTTGSNNIVIGSDARLTNAAGSYQLNIGNLIRGIMSGTKSVTVDGTFAANSLSTAGGIAGASLNVTGLGNFGSLTSAAITSSGLVSAGTLNVTGATTLGAGATVTTGNLQVSAGNVSARIGNFSGGLVVGDVAQVSKGLVLTEQSAPFSHPNGTGSLFASSVTQGLKYRLGYNGDVKDILLSEKAALNDLVDARSYKGANAEDGASIYLGQNSGTSATNSHLHNTALGNSALAGSNPGTANTALGSEAMSSIQGGVENIAIGARAAKKLTQGNQNISIGSAAGYNLTGGGNNILIGSYAGFSNTPEKNLTTGTDNILIGTYVTTTNGHSVNELNIGNLIKGQHADYNGVGKFVSIEGNLTTTGLLKVAGGSPALGKVLTAIDTAGNATWQAVPAATVAPNSVDSSKIADWSITGNDIGISTITGTNIANGSVTQWDLAPGSVMSSTIIDGSVTASDLADLSVTNEKILSVDASKITGIINLPSPNTTAIKYTTVPFSSEQPPSYIPMANGYLDKSGSGTVYASDLWSKSPIASITMQLQYLPAGTIPKIKVRLDSDFAEDFSTNPPKNPYTAGIYTLHIGQISDMPLDSRVINLVICPSGNVQLNGSQSICKEVIAKRGNAYQLLRLSGSWSTLGF